jgi:ubiquinone biosynthesis protein
MEQAIIKLRGVFVKIGQVFTSRRDWVPVVYYERLKKLTDDVPPLPWFEMKPFIEKSLGKKIEEVFADVDPKAIAAASIAQVHVAHLKNGKKVALKVQYPNGESIFSFDVDNIQLVAWLSDPEFYEFGKSMRVGLFKEFNFRDEAKYQIQVKKNLRAFRQDVLVPELYLEYCTDKVLVMEFMNGQKVMDYANAHPEEIDFLAERISEIFGHMIFIDSLFHGNVPINYLHKTQNIFFLKYPPHSSIKPSLFLLLMRKISYFSCFLRFFFFSF